MNVLGQIYFMDMFLGGEFTTYGADVVSMSELEPDQREDPMSRVFPKVGPHGAQLEYNAAGNTIFFFFDDDYDYEYEFNKKNLIGLLLIIFLNKI